MVFNATFNNITVILWRSVLLVEETGVSGQNHWPTVSHWQTLSHKIVSSTPRLRGVRTHNVSGDRHRLHMQLQIQLPYDHDQGSRWASPMSPFAIFNFIWRQNTALGDLFGDNILFNKNYLYCCQSTAQVRNIVC